MKINAKTQSARCAPAQESSRPLRRHALNLAILAILYPPLSNANPDGAQIVSGQVSIDTATPGVTTITNSPNAIINWQNFSIAQNELTQFIQQNGQSAVLNRIIGQNPSEILGQLASNGKVFLINPNGIVFGAGAAIDTQGLIASSLNLSDQDFLSGNYHFIAGSGAGNIVNEGIIRAGKDGNVILIAPQIQNNGIIKSDGGSITLAAGQELTITNLDNPDIRFQIQAPTDSALNLGKLLAEGGAVNVFASTIKHSGEISADSVEVDAQGNIKLVAQQDIMLTADSKISANNNQGIAGSVHIESKTGTALVQGTIEAQATQSGKGGKIEVLGEQVGLLDKAKIDASGQNGGGQVLVGGDYQGKNAEVHNAKANYIGKETTIKADAKTNGDGGKVVAWANNTTRAYGNISARGGQQGGDGGSVEVSGKQHLTYQAHTDTQAPRGKTGTLLLDPTNIWIDYDQSSATRHGMTGTDISANTGAGGIFAASGSASDSLLTTASLVSALNDSNVIVQTENANGTGLGNITVGSAVTWNGPHSLKLLAENNIAVNADVNATGSGNLTLVAGWDSSSGTGNPSTITETGDISVASGVTAHGSNLYAYAGNDILSSGTGKYTGYITLKAGGNINLTLDGDFTAATTTEGKSISVKDPGALVISSQGISTVDGNVSLNPTGATYSSIGGPINLGNGSLSLHSTAATTYNVAADTTLRAGSVNLDATTTLRGLGDLSLKSDNLSMPSGSLIESVGSLSIGPKSDDRNMRIGGTYSSGFLYLSDFSQLSPGTSLILGSDDSNYTGTTTIAGSIVNPPADLTIRAGGSGSSGNLIVNPGASITNTGNNADTVLLAAGHNIIFGDTNATSNSNSINIGNSGSGRLLVQLKPDHEILTDQHEELIVGGSGNDSTYTRLQILNGKTWDHQGTLNLQTGASVRLGDAAAAARFDNNGIVNITSASSPFTSYNSSLDGVLNNYGTINVSANSTFGVKFSQTASGELNIDTADTILTLQNLGNVAGTVNLTSSTLRVSEYYEGSNNRFENTAINEYGSCSTIKIGGAGGSAQYSPIATFTGVDASNVDLVIDDHGSLKIADGNSKFKTVTLGGNGLTSMSSGTLNVTYGDFLVPDGVTYTGTNIGYMADGGNLTVEHAISKSDNVSSSLLLAAGGNVIVNRPITATNGSMNVTLQAHNTDDNNAGNVQINSDIATNGGNLVVGGGLDARITAAIGYNASGATADRYGISIQNATINTGGGNITMRGQGVDNAIGDADGIDLWDSTAILQSGSGNIQLFGQAGNNPTSYSSGIYIGGTVQATGGGTVALTGNGGTNNNDVYIRGVRVQGGSVSTANGSLTIDGSVNATNSTSAGVQVDSSASVSTTGTGQLAIIGNAGTSNGRGIAVFDGGSIRTENSSVALSLRADSLYLGAGTGTRISGAGAVELAPLNNTDMCIGSPAACEGFFSIDPSSNSILSHVSAAGALVLGRAVADTDYTGTLTVKNGTSIDSSAINGSKLALNGRNVVIESGSSIGSNLTAFSKSLDILANNNVTVGGNIYTGSTGNFLVKAGNAIAVSSAVTTQGQDVLFNADSDSNNGGNIVMNAGSSITSHGGDIVMGGGSCSSSGCTGAASGYGTSVRSESDGILFNGSNASGVSLNSGGGNIWLRGKGINHSGSGSSTTGHTGLDGFYLTLNSGVGSVYIKGSGGSGQGFGQGIYLQSSTLSSSTNMELRGEGSDSATGSNNSGINLYSTTLSNNGNSTSSISLTGTGGAGTASNYGVYVGVDSTAGTGSDITTSGTLTINGTGGGSGTGTSNSGIGLVSASLSAAIMNLTGTGGSGTNFNRGIDAWAFSSTLGGSQLTSTGNMSLTGTGGTTSTGLSNSGINFFSTKLDSGSGTMTITGTGGSGTASNNGIYLSVDTNAHTVSELKTTGTLVINGTGGAAATGNSNKGIALLSASLDAGTMTLTGTGGGGVSFNSGIESWAFDSDLGGSQLNSSGNITLTGNGGTSATGTSNIGTYLLSATLSGGTGTSHFITLNGTGGSGTSSNYGVYIGVDTTAEARSDVTTSGTLTVNGTGGSGTGANNSGISLASTTMDANIVSLQGSGGSGTNENLGIAVWAYSNVLGGSELKSAHNMAIEGNGGTSVSGTGNHGAYFQTATIKTLAGGDLSVNGQGGGTGSSNYGISTYTSSFSSGAGSLKLSGTGASSGYGLDINNGTTVGGASGQTGSITLIADTASGSDSIRMASSGTSPIIQGTGALALKPLNDSTDTGMLGGNGTFNLSANELNYIQNGFSSITIGNSTGTGSILYGDSSRASYNFMGPLVLQGYDITINDALAIGNDASNSGSLTLQANNKVILANNANLTTYGQNIALNGDRDSDGLGSIEISSSSINSYGGNITLGGGTTPSSTAAYGYPGIQISNATISAGNGNLSIRGAGIANMGFGTTGIDIYSSQLSTSGTGNITLNGAAGNWTNGNFGVKLNNSSLIAGGAINIDSSGLGSGSNTKGVYLYDSQLTNTGTISITASGTGTAADLFQSDGWISNRGSAGTATGSNDITLSGSNLTLHDVRSQHHIVLNATGDVSLSASTSESDYVDDDYFVYNLPFAFTFFGTSYSQAYISSNGLITFGSGTAAYSDSLSNLAAYKAIAPAWNDWVLRTSSGKNIFISQPTVSDLAVKWNVNRYASESNAAVFETVLNSSGNITFNYGAANSSFANDVTIGLSNGSSSIGSQLMTGFTSLDNLHSTTFTPSGGSYTETVSGSGGTLASTTPVYSGTSGFNIGNSTALTALSNITINAANTITQTGQIESSNGGNIVLTAGGSYVNNFGSNAFSVNGSGRWLIYSANPANNTLNGLTPTFKHYNCQSATSCTDYSIPAIGNGLLYSIAPMLQLTPGAATSTYGNSVNLAGLSYTLTGTYIDGDTPSDLSGTASFSTTATASTSIGNYDIVYTGGLTNNLGYTLVNNSSSLNELSITPRPVTVTADNITRAYNTENPVFTGHITSGSLANSDTLSSIGLSFATPATQTSIVGTYAITPHLSNNNYVFTGIDGVLTITSYVLNIAANAASKVYGDADPLFTYSVTGFVNGDSASILTGALSRTPGETVAGGPYAINLGSLASTNPSYAIEFTGANFTITPAQLSISANNLTKIYGEPIPSLTATAIGLKNGDTNAIVTGLTTIADITSSVGGYVIDASAASAGANYTIASTANGNLTINPAVLNIAANALSKTYGDPDPIFTYTASGFVNGDSSSILAGALARAAGETVAGGPYAINQGSLNSTSNNYLLQYTGSNLTITPRPLNVVASDASKDYGDPDPIFAYTASGFANGDSSSILTGSLSREPGETVSGGPYDILLGSLSGGGNYNIDFTEAHLTINPSLINGSEDSTGSSVTESVEQVSTTVISSIAQQSSGAGRDVDGSSSTGGTGGSENSGGSKDSDSSSSSESSRNGTGGSTNTNGSSSSKTGKGKNAKECTK